MNGAGVIRRSIPWLAALVSGALCPASCGGEASPSDTHKYTKIDDMEGEGTFIQWPAPAGATQGGWFTATDCTQNDRISPPPWEVAAGGWSFAALPEPHETMPGTLSMHASRLRTTTPLVGIWGANMGFGFAGVPDPDAAVPPEAGVDDAGACVSPPNTYPNPPADLTAYAGVTFWARAASPGGRAVRVQVNDVNTDPRGGICQEQNDTASDYCYNGFGVLIQLTDTFRQYTLDFSQFTQRSGWGYHPPDGIDWSRVFTMAFEMDLPGCSASSVTMCAGGVPSLSFDFWIDDLYFVNK
jgi:hypothetical protein